MPGWSGSIAWASPGNSVSIAAATAAGSVPGSKPSPAGGKTVMRKRVPPHPGTNVVIAGVGSALPGIAVMPWSVAHTAVIEKSFMPEMVTARGGAASLAKTELPSGVCPVTTRLTFLGTGVLSRSQHHGLHLASTYVTPRRVRKRSGGKRPATIKKAATIRPPSSSLADAWKGRMGYYHDDDEAGAYCALGARTV